MFRSFLLGFCARLSRFLAVRADVDYGLDPLAGGISTPLDQAAA